MSVQTKIQTFDGNVGIGTNDPGSESLKVVGGTTSLQALTVTSLTIGASTSAHAPSGLIIMWSGSIIPTGWSLCDGGGSPARPDLRDRFILSKGASNNIGQTGGSNNLTFTSANLPPHTHTVNATNQTAAHSHTLNALGNNATTHNHNVTLSQSGAHTHTTNVSGGAHTHNTNTNTANHQHNASTGNANANHRHWQGLILRDWNSPNFKQPAPNMQNTRSDNTAPVHIYQSNVPNIIERWVPAQPGQRRYYGVQSSGAHVHQGANTAVNNQAHAHPAPASNAGNSPHAHNVSVAAGGPHSHNLGTFTTTNHSHTIQHSPSGAHSHNSTTGSTGQGGTVIKMPPYYALAFIIKD